MFIRIVRHIRIPLIVALLFAISSWRSARPAPLQGHPIKEAVKCTILFDEGTLTEERAANLSKALLGTYGEFNNCDVAIEPQLEEVENWKRLKKGRYDIIVLDTATAIPPRYKKFVRVSLEISPGKVWAVSSRNPNLLTSINFWFAYFCNSDDYTFMKRRYLRPPIHLNPHYFKGGGSNGSISDYDDIIKRYSEFVGVDWRLISAIIYEESRFNLSAVSSRNARGLMQVKATTAAIYGVYDVHDPELNIKAGTLHIGDLINRYKSQGMDYNNAVKFALGSYNAGAGRINICRQTAEKLGYNPDIWEDVVMAFPRVADFKGYQTVKYVDGVIQKYHQYCSSVN